MQTELVLTSPIETHPRQRRTNGLANKLATVDRPAHDWYRFVLSFPPHLVREYAERFELCPGASVLDPFCGTGTTLVECKKIGFQTVGMEANPMAHFASTVKLDWSADPAGLVAHAEMVAEIALRKLARDGFPENDLLCLEERDYYYGLRTLDSETKSLLLTGSISPMPLHRTLVLVDVLTDHPQPAYEGYERLALAKALVTKIGNLEFGPEVGVGPAKRDVHAVTDWLSNVRAIADDLELLNPLDDMPSCVHLADSRNSVGRLAPNSIDAVICSPPYPNEKDYTRTTRLESVILGFIRSKADLQALKRNLLRSNTRNVYKLDDDDLWVQTHPGIQSIANAIEERRIALGKTSGFERLYSRVTKLYFGGMMRHLADLRSALRPGARLAYVVGDQASYLRVMIRTGSLLADLATHLGFQVESIDLFRTRLATATKEQLREEVVVLRWPG